MARPSEAVIRTSELPVNERREAWRGTICDVLAPVDLLLPDEPVDGEIVGRTLGDLEVARLRSSTNQTVHRTPGLIRSHSCGVYRVVLSLSRTAIGFEQGENACRLVYNELVVYDVDRPYHVHHAGTGDMDFVVVSIPRDRLPVPEGAVAAVTATALAGGVSALAGSMLRHTARDAAPAAAEPDALLAGAVVNVVAAAMLERLAAQSVLAYNDETAQARRAAADAYIDANLADPALAPAAVAAGVFVSLRHLHRLYAMTGTTVTERIRHARMQRCQDDLCNPAFAAVPVSAIGARWGMPDAAHFSRAFSAHFDCPPAAYRRRHLG